MEPIAIVGMACRLPGAPSLEEFWSLLEQGRHAIDLIPESRWNRELTFDPDPEKAGKINTRYGAFIEGIDRFDNRFFRISAEEARQMDPQQRMMLELAYEALADAGVSPLEVDGTESGVFVGVMSNEYLQLQTSGEFARIDRYTGAGAGYSMIANRISSQFNLQGPSMAIDSACSSSLLATFLACQSLWMNECSLALAGGVNLILSPALNMFYTRAGLSAADGKCRTLSHDASGMGRGEGAGVVVLKRLADAVREGNPVYAVIRGGAVNHNGRGNGMSAPNRWAQESLLRKAYQHAGVDAGDLDYVELHGTGTLIGDAVEATALGSVLAEDHRERRCRVGSVKTNLGHLEGAAGVAGLIKLALCLHHGKLAPSLWHAGPNPHVSWDTLPLEMQSQLQDWPEHGRLRLAGISSFGLGGANAHLVLQSPPARRPAAPLQRTDHSMVHLSARSEPALVEMARRYRALIEDLPPERFSALCQTTLVRAQAHEHRATFVARNQEEMQRHLSGFAAARHSPPNVFAGRHNQGRTRKRVFIFPAYGPSDFRAIGGFFKIHTCLQSTLEECDQAIREVLADPFEFRLAELCEAAAHTDGRIRPFIHLGVQLALARLWQAAGLEPDAVVGIGMGRFAAWVVSGAVTVKTAVARIAALHQLELTLAGAISKTETRPFATDCYSSAGKNVVSEDRDLTEADPAGFPGILPEMPRWKAVDYFLQSLNSMPSSFPGIEATCVAAPPTAQEFWLELAPLTVRHNVRWKNLLPDPMSIRLPRYPWQQSRFWLEGNDAAEIAATARRGPSATEEVDEEKRKHDNPENRSEGGETTAKSEQAAASAGSALVGLTRERLLHLPKAERKSAFSAYIKERIAETLRLPAEAMEESQTFTGLGIDSLSALRLKNRVESDLKMPVSLMKFLDGSIEDLASDFLSQRLENEPSSVLPAALPEPAASNHGPAREYAAGYDLPAEMAEMPSEEIDRLLHELLSSQAAQQQNASLNE